MSNVQTKKFPGRIGKKDGEEIMKEIILYSLELKNVSFRIEGTTKCSALTLTHVSTKFQETRNKEKILKFSSLSS